MVDPGPPDLGPPDRGRPDLGAPDAGPPDLGPADLGVPINPSDPIARTLPEDGEVDVLPGTNILLLFTTEMDPLAGTVEVEPGGLVLSAATGTWLRSSGLFPNPSPDLQNVAVILSPGGLQSGLQFTVTVRNDFRDAAGRRLSGAPDDSALLVFEFITR